MEITKHEDLFKTSEDNIEKLIIKRTEISDIYYFMNEGINGYKSFAPIFGNFDLEMVYETSIFSISLHDTLNNSIVGIFIFNDNPTGALKRDGFNQIDSIWETWYDSYYENNNLDGKNSLWLVYICMTEYYCINKEFLKKIFHKILLSMYTTLPNIKACFIIMTNKTFSEISEAESKDEYSQEGIVINPYFVIKTLVTYLYKPAPELDFPLNKETNNMALLLTIRDTVFPVIEIRDGTQEDHDDLENIFKDQTPSNVANLYEDFFIAKMIADKDENKKVLVGQVNDKAVGMLAISTDVNVKTLCMNYELEEYDNLCKNDFMRAVKFKRNEINNKLNSEKANELMSLNESYIQEIKSCSIISQRIRLQEYILKNTDKFLSLEVLEKKNFGEEKAIEYFTFNISKFDIKYPNLEKYYKKIKIDEGSSLLIDKLSFYLETLSFFGLLPGYLKGEGHWDNYVKQLEKKKALREAWKKQMQKDTKQTKKVVKKVNKKEEEFKKKKEFDFEPIDSALILFKKANSNTRSTLRRIIIENKKLISNFFVDKNNEPSESRCFDLCLLPKKLKENKILFPEELNELIVPILSCFGCLEYDKQKVMKLVEVEEKIEEKKKDDKKKNVKKKEVVVEEKKEEDKYQEVTEYLVSISEFFKSVETCLDYDKLNLELSVIDSDKLVNELSDLNEKVNNEKIIDGSSFLYDNIKKQNLKIENELNIEASKKYSKDLEEYTNSMDLPTFNENVLNCFSVKLYFIEQAFESRSTEFLLKAFDCFPDKDYMIITQPHSFSENALLEPFIKIQKKVESMFPEILYILHRESLLVILIKASYCTEEDLKKGAYLFECLDNDSVYMYNICLEAIKDEECKFKLIVIKINDNVIGLTLISKEINLDYYDSHFNLRDFVNLDKLNNIFNGRIYFFSVHKNFRQFNKLILKEVTRLLNKFTLYYEYYTELKYPSFLNDLIQCKSRKFPTFINSKEFIDDHVKKIENTHKKFEDEKIRTKMDGEEKNENDFTESECCLMLLTKRMFYETKISNNNRIVIVGASDTGISFIESLLSIRYLNFSYIYLVAPGGFDYHHIQNEFQNLKVSYTSYQMSEVKKLLLENRINIIDSKIKKINRSHKFISFEDNSILQYDYLVLTLGLQDTLQIELSNTIKNQISEEFLKKVKEKEEEIAKNNELISNQANQQNSQKEGKDPKKENIKLNQEVVGLNETKNAIISSLSFISIDDPKIYKTFAPGNKLIKSLKKNPLLEIIIYGRSFNLLCFVQGMLERGIDGKKLKLIIPTKSAHFQMPNLNAKDRKEMNNNIDQELEFTNTSSLETSPEIEEHLFKVLESKGVKVLKNYNYKGLKFNEAFNKIETYVFSKEISDDEEDEQLISGTYFVTGGLINVDQQIFNFIHDNGLVYNGRAIVDKNFMTSDTNIFAAGRLCEFSQRYSYTEKEKHLKLER